MTPEGAVDSVDAGDSVGLDWLARWRELAPDAVALQMGEDGRGLTYAGVFDQATRIAGALRDRFGVARGDRVAVLAQNELEYVGLFFATQRLGAILVPINFRFTATEVAFVVADSGASLVIAAAEYADRVPDVRTWDFGELCAVARTADCDGAPVEFRGRSEDPCMILYTSGTTGFPKGAIITPRMMFWNSVNTGLRLDLTRADVVVTFLPLFHTGGWNVLTTPCLHRGARVILLRKFDADLILDLVARERVTVLFGVPTTMDFLSRADGFATADLGSVRYAIVGGEPMPGESIDVWQDRGVPIRQGYGLTEFGPNVFSLNEADALHKRGSIGFPNFYVDARIVDDVGSTLGADQVGELILRGPVAMAGYWNNPAATAATIRDGWLYTGDLVRRDGEGYYYVVGRKKEMFISGGENVYPAEIEKVLRAHPSVREAAVIGRPHARWGECGHAYVSAEAGLNLHPDDLAAHCRAHLAKFKVPDAFFVLDDLPKTDSGKIAKRRLADLVSLRPDDATDPAPTLR